MIRSSENNYSEGYTRTKSAPVRYTCGNGRAGWRDKRLICLLRAARARGPVPEHFASSAASVTKNLRCEGAAACAVLPSHGQCVGTRGVPLPCGRTSAPLAGKSKSDHHALTLLQDTGGRAVRSGLMMTDRHPAAV
jgi:hypothetical protein